MGYRYNESNPNWKKFGFYPKLNDNTLINNHAQSTYGEDV